MADTGLMRLRANTGANANKCPLGLVLLIILMMIMLMMDDTKHGKGNKDNGMTNYQMSSDKKITGMKNFLTSQKLNFHELSTVCKTCYRGA